MPESKLLSALANLRRRLLGISLGRALGWSLVAALLVLIACAWADLALDLSGGIRLACLLGAMTLATVLLVWVLASAIRQARGDSLARRLDQTAGTGGQILAGVDLHRQFAGSAAVGSAVSSPLSGAMARMAVERAANLADGVRAAAAVPLKPLYWPVAGLLTIGIGLAILFAAAPRLATTQWLRFTEPFADHPPYSSIEFAVQPGSARIIYGGSLDVRVSASGGVVQQLDLVLLPAGTKPADGKSAEQVLPMFPEPGGSWRATLTEVTAPGRYFVRTRGARSARFDYELITIPEIREVRFRVTPPAYTHRPAYEGPLPQDGLAGLPGTTVQVWVKSNRELSAGQAKFTTSEPMPVAAGSPVTPPSTPLAPVAPGSTEVTGTFTITQPGRVELGVTDTAGQLSRSPSVAPVQVLADERPFIRVMEPKPQSYATPDVVLNVVLQAEDDYGVAGVQLFRSLNDSRPRPIDAAVPSNQPTRVQTTVPLRLSEYGLKPGDVIRLFARVEDTDPLGPKGSESPVVSIQIISKEDLNRMTLARQGMETLQTKYEQARRRLEALDEQIRKLQEETAKLPPEGEASAELQKKFEDLARETEKAAADIARNAGEDLPFDVDRAMRQQLYDLAAHVRDAGKRFEHASGQLGGSVADGKKAMDKLREEIGTKRKEFEEKTTEPLEHLAKIYPLKEDEARFAELYQRQRDLSDRMQSLKGSAGDDPKLKARLRDLELEQRQIREELRELLDDIDSHLAALPADPKLDELRQQTAAFVNAVRQSNAAAEMNSSETSLSEFKGADAAGHAKTAADILEQFLGKCKGMGDQASQCLGFNPTLSQSLGNTVEQLLGAEGLNPGMGQGAGGGYSARRSTLRNVGLYGSTPLMSPQSRSGGNDRSNAGGAHSAGNTPDTGDPGQNNSVGRFRGAGRSETEVPPRYKRQVGEYFQRVADELEK